MPLRSSSQDDWLLRQLRAVAAVVGRVLGRRQAGEHEAVIEEIEAARKALLGSMEGLIMRVDSTSAAHLIGDPRQILGLAELLREEGITRREMGDAARGDAALRRGLEMAIEAARRDPSLDRVREVVDGLAAQVDRASLAPAYRDAITPPAQRD
jgi:hypothetical protein